MSCMTAPDGQFFDLGPDPAWDNLYPGPPVCFQVRGLVPKQASFHPDLTPAQMATQYHGLFTGELLPVSGVFFGTDASDGPRKADSRMRVVSWAAVAVRVTTHPVHSPGEGAYELLGTMTGTLRIGATVNEGEQVAINKLAEWATMPVRSSSSAARAAPALLDQGSSRCDPALP